MPKVFPWQIRPILTHDICPAATLITESFYNLHSVLVLLTPVIYWGIYLDLSQRFRDKRPGYQCFVAIQARQPLVIGVVELEAKVIGPQRPGYPSIPSPYLSNLAVHPDYRRQGVAQQLLQFAEAWVLHANNTDLYLHVLSSHHVARNLYKKLGYVESLEESHWLLPSRLLLHKSLPIPPHKIPLDVTKGQESIAKH